MSDLKNWNFTFFAISMLYSLVISWIRYVVVRKKKKDSLAEACLFVAFPKFLSHLDHTALLETFSN